MFVQLDDLGYILSQIIVPYTKVANYIFSDKLHHFESIHDVLSNKDFQ